MISDRDKWYYCSYKEPAPAPRVFEIYWCLCQQQNKVTDLYVFDNRICSKNDLYEHQQTISLLEYIKIHGIKHIFS